MWWITGLECGPLGPYDTKAEAEDDRKGVARFYGVPASSAEIVKSAEVDHESDV